MSKVILTKSQLITFKPCDLDKRLALFGDKSRLTVRQALTLGISVSDILWVAGALGLGKECSDFAQSCAGRAARYATAGTAATDAARNARYAADAARYAARCAARYATAGTAATDARYAADATRCAARCAAHYAADAADAASRNADYAADAVYYSDELAIQKSDLIRIFG